MELNENNLEEDKEISQYDLYQFGNPEDLSEMPVPFEDDCELAEDDDCIMLEETRVLELLSDANVVFYEDAAYFVPSDLQSLHRIKNMWGTSEGTTVVDCLNDSKILIEEMPRNLAFSVEIENEGIEEHEEFSCYFLVYKKGIRRPLQVWLCRTNHFEFLIGSIPGSFRLDPGNYVWGITHLSDPAVESLIDDGLVMRELVIEAPCIEYVKVPEPGLLEVIADSAGWSLRVPLSDFPDDWPGFTVTVYDDGWRLLADLSGFRGEQSFSHPLLPYGSDWYVLLSDRRRRVAGYTLHRSGKDTINSSWSEGEMLRRMDAVCGYLEPKAFWKDELMKMPGLTGIRYSLVREAAYLQFCEKADLFHNALVLEAEDNGYTMRIANALARLVTGFTVNYVDVHAELVSMMNSPLGIPFIKEFEDSSPVCLMNAGLLAGPEATRLLDRIVSYMAGQPLVPVVLCDTGERIRHLFAQSPKLATYFQPELDYSVGAFTPEDIYMQVVARVRDLKLTLSGDVERRLMDYLVDKSEEGQHWAKADINQFVRDMLIKPHVNRCDMNDSTEILDIHLLGLVPAMDYFEGTMRDLDALVGLKELKAELRSLFDVLRLSHCRMSKGLPSLSGGVHHCIFTGNPGTGKSTVAALMGKLFKSLGILSKGQVITVERRTLVGAYIGHTERNLTTVLQQARGNVLFIDEAYSLSVGDNAADNDFGNQVLQGLLTVLADEHPDMVIIMAGYEEDIDRMLSKNQGMSGRFPYRFDFADYTADELFEIGTGMLERKQLKLTADAACLLREFIESKLLFREIGFSNGRWIMQLLDSRLIPAMARRVMSSQNKTEDDLRFIEADDVRAISQGVMKVGDIKKGKSVAGDINRFFFIKNDKNYGSYN